MRLFGQKKPRLPKILSAALMGSDVLCRALDADRTFLPVLPPPAPSVFAMIWPNVSRLLHVGHPVTKERLLVKEESPALPATPLLDGEQIRRVSS